MTSAAQFYSASDAARRLGVSVKALRLYEERGLVTPTRSAAGWRAFGPEAMARGAEIVALRTIGLSLSRVAQVLSGDAEGFAVALAAHQSSLREQIGHLSRAVDRVAALQSDLAQGKPPNFLDLTHALVPTGCQVSFDLPWPWGGERFELHHLRPLNYIVGPLGSGKTRLAERLSETIPDCTFLGPDRNADDSAAARQKIATDASLKLRVDQALAWLIEDGVEVSGALITLLSEIESDGGSIVIDMVEQGLGQSTQEALVAYLRRRPRDAKPLFLLTRSSAILDLAAMGAQEQIFFCPANHSVPMVVHAHPGSPGYDSVATCLASPEVRARTEGVIAWRPEVA